MEVTNLTRRGLLGAFLAAPAIVRASSLMAMPRAPLLFDPNSITATQIAVGTLKVDQIFVGDVIQYAFDYKRKLVWYRTSKSQWNGDPDKGIGGEPINKLKGFMFSRRDLGRENPSRHQNT